LNKTPCKDIKDEKKPDTLIGSFIVIAREDINSAPVKVLDLNMSTKRSLINNGIIKR
jgi:hypothetical protein